MKSIFKHKEKFHLFFFALSFLFSSLSAHSNDSIIGQLGQSLLEQHERELYDREYRERPPGWDRRDDDWRRDQGEHRGWERGKHKGWEKHYQHHKHHHKHHRHHHPHHYEHHHKHEGRKHKENGWHGREWKEHQGSGKWGRK